MKERTVMLAAVEAVANANPVRCSGRRDPDVSTKATASVSVHAVSSEFQNDGLRERLAFRGFNPRQDCALGDLRPGLRS